MEGDTSTSFMTVLVRSGFAKVGKTRGHNSEESDGDSYLELFLHYIKS